MAKKMSKRVPGAWKAFAAGAALCLAAATLWSAGLSRAEVGGYSQVSRLEVAYAPGQQALQARVSLVSGMALTWQPASEQDARMLLEMAGAHPPPSRVEGDLAQAQENAVPAHAAEQLRVRGQQWKAHLFGQSDVHRVVQRGAVGPGDGIRLAEKIPFR